MARASLNGVNLFYEITGDEGLPLILVHGSWDSHEDWQLVVPGLAKPFRVLTYDRRGHSQSTCSPGQGSIHEDVADLAALIEHLDLAPAWVAGNSFGASITLRLASERPDLLRGIIAHEPPLFSLLADDPASASMNCRPLNGFLVFCFTANPLAPPARHSPGKETFKAATEPSPLSLRPDYM
jgi:pimeloyl-ACP methyl ester carboxylesterase